jgi:hypothetical protein
MTTQDAVDCATELYRSEGYEVTAPPPSDHLPPFAAALGMDLYATKGEEHVLIRAVPSRHELKGDEKTVHAATVLENRSDGWRLDVVILSPVYPDGPLHVIDLTDAEQPLRVVDRPPGAPARTGPTPVELNPSRSADPASADTTPRT